VLWINPLSGPGGTYSHQGFVGVPTLNPPSPIAEPEAIALLGVGLFGFAALRKKMN